MERTGSLKQAGLQDCPGAQGVPVPDHPTAGGPWPRGGEEGWLLLSPTPRLLLMEGI